MARKLLPWPIHRIAADAGADRVQDDIADGLEEMLLGLDRGRREACLEQVPPMPVTLVEASCVHAVQAVHPPREVSAGEPREQVKVVPHQAVRQAAPPKAVYGLREKRHEHAPVEIVDEDLLAADTARRDVDDATDWFQARCATHLAATLTRARRGVQMAGRAVPRADVAPCLARCSQRSRLAPRPAACRERRQAASAAVRSPSSPAIGRSAATTFAMCSSSSRPRSSAPA